MPLLHTPRKVSPLAPNILEDLASLSVLPLGRRCNTPPTHHGDACSGQAHLPQGATKSTSVIVDDRQRLPKDKTLSDAKSAKILGGKGLTFSGVCNKGMPRPCYCSTLRLSGSVWHM